MRYTTRSAWVERGGDWNDTSVTADQIIVTDEDYRPSGILNAAGEMLYRQRERVPFGFRVTNGK